MAEEGIDGRRGGGVHYVNMQAEQMKHTIGNHEEVLAVKTRTMKYKACEGREKKTRRGRGASGTSASEQLVLFRHFAREENLQLELNKRISLGTPKPHHHPIPILCLPPSLPPSLPSLLFPITSTSSRLHTKMCSREAPSSLGSPDSASCLSVTAERGGGEAKGR
eukprot:766411-Hanusia_phi.AAC.12